MARKPKYKEGMVVHPSVGERVADIIIDWFLWFVWHWQLFRCGIP